MYRVNVTLKGLAPLSCSKKHDAPKMDGESHDDYDRRTWREKANYDENGIVFVPAMAFKQGMDEAAKRAAIPDPDNKRANMTKYFVSDVICEQNLSISVHKDAMPSITIQANVDGVRGSGKRVPRTFPQIQEWGGDTSFLVMNEKITLDIFRKVLDVAAMSIGVGQFRAGKGGLNGRFEVVSLKVQKL